MSDTKHSLLPWRADDKGIIRSADGIAIAQVWDNADTGIEASGDEVTQLNEDLIIRSVNTHAGLLEALANATATIKMLYGWEPIEAEKDKVRWEGPRKEMPEGFTEISNSAGVPPIVMKNVLEGYEKALATARA